MVSYERFSKWAGNGCNGFQDDSLLYLNLHHDRARATRPLRVAEISGTCPRCLLPGVQGLRTRGQRADPKNTRWSPQRHRPRQPRSPDSRQ
jgi:hypothetical protein